MSSTHSVQSTGLGVGDYKTNKPKRQKDLHLGKQVRNNYNRIKGAGKRVSIETKREPLNLEC